MSNADRNPIAPKVDRAKTPIELRWPEHQGIVEDLIRGAITMKIAAGSLRRRFFRNSLSREIGMSKWRPFLATV